MLKRRDASAIASVKYEARVSDKSGVLDIGIVSSSAENALGIASEFRSVPARHSAQALLVEAALYGLLMNEFKIAPDACIGAPGTNTVAQRTAAREWDELGSEESRVVAIQDLLVKLEFYKGPRVATWTEATQRAARRFQASKRLAPNGQPTGHLYLALKEELEVREQAASAITITTTSALVGSTTPPPVGLATITGFVEGHADSNPPIVGVTGTSQQNTVYVRVLPDGSIFNVYGGSTTVSGAGTVINVLEESYPASLLIPDTGVWFDDGELLSPFPSWDRVLFGSE